MAQSHTVWRVWIDQSWWACSMTRAQMNQHDHRYFRLLLSHAWFARDLSLSHHRVSVLLSLVLAYDKNIQNVTSQPDFPYRPDRWANNLLIHYLDRHPPPYPQNNLPLGREVGRLLLDFSHLFVAQRASVAYQQFMNQPDITGYPPQHLPDKDSS